MIGAQAIPGPQVALAWVAAAARLMRCHPKVVTVFGQSGEIATMKKPTIEEIALFRAPTRFIVI